MTAYIVILLCSGVFFLAGQPLFGILTLGFMLIVRSTHDDVEKAKSVAEASWSTATGVVMTLALAALLIFLAAATGGSFVSDDAILRELLGG